MELPDSPTLKGKVTRCHKGHVLMTAHGRGPRGEPHCRVPRGRAHRGDAALQAPPERPQPPAEQVSGGRKPDGRNVPQTDLCPKRLPDKHRYQSLVFTALEIAVGCMPVSPGVGCPSIDFPVASSGEAWPASDFLCDPGTDPCLPALAPPAVWPGS